MKIRASWIVAPSDWTPLLLEKPDLMRHQGKSYLFEPVRYAGTPAAITAMANNEVELGNLAFSSLAIAIQNAGLDDLRVIGDQFRDGEGSSYSNQDFLEKNRAAMLDFMEDALRVVRWYLDPANHDAAVAIASRLTKQPPERFAGWLFTAKEYSRSPDLLPNLQALQANIEVQRELGFLKGPLDISRYTDLSLVQEAAARMK